MDFRCTEYCKQFSSISKKKKAFILDYRKEHPKVKNFFDYISDNKSKYKLKFIENVYNGKCVYCGNDLRNIPLLLFEIDHYIPKTSSPHGIHDINNLVSSCRICNRLKSNYLFHDLKKFDIENGFPTLFERDELFNIIISNSYADDLDVKAFYEQIGYSLQIRRLDYLLLALQGMINEYKDNEIRNELLNAINILSQKRNKMLTL